MNGIGKMFFGTTMFGLGVIAGYYACKRRLEEQYRMDVDDIQTFYNEKLDEFGVMDPDVSFEHFDADYDDDDDDDDDADYDDDDDDDDDDDYDDDDYDDDDEEYTSYTPSSNDTRRVVVDYTKPSLEAIQKALRSEGVSVIVNSNGEENLGQIDEAFPEDDENAPYQYSDEELEQIAEEYAYRRSENMRDGNPYLIKPEEYADGPEDYDRQALYYYSRDRVLCEDDDIKVDDEEECVGFDYEDMLDMQTTAWVRNDKLRVLYEIHRIDDSYQKAVLGVIETPREREFRIQGRRRQALDDQFESRKS